MKSINITNSITHRSSHSLSRYLSEIKKCGSLSPAQECELVKKVREGNYLALDKLISANLRFVVAVAKHYQNQGIGLPDLICEGNLGLLKAVQRYDETKGFRFTSYAVWWIRQSILQALSTYSRCVRLPQHKIKTLRKINVAFLQLEQEFEREPSMEELASLMNIELSDVQSALSIKMKQVSIDAPLNHTGEINSLADIINNSNAERPDHEISTNESMRMEVESLFAGLNENQAEVVKMYYGFYGVEEMTLSQISKKLNVSSERVRQIKDAALIRIKKSIHCKRLKECIN